MCVLPLWGPGRDTLVLTRAWTSLTWGSPPLSLMRSCSLSPQPGSHSPLWATSWAPQCSASCGPAPRPLQPGSHSPLWAASPLPSALPTRLPVPGVTPRKQFKGSGKWAGRPEGPRAGNRWQGGCGIQDSSHV